MGIWTISIHVSVPEIFLKAPFLWFSFWVVSLTPLHVINQSSHDGHMCCLHVLAIVNSSVMNILGCMYLFKLEFYLYQIFPGVVLLDYMVALFLFLFFKEPLYLFCILGASTYIPHQQHRRVPFSPHSYWHLLFVGFWWYPFCLSSVQLLSHVWLFATPWTAACQGSLSITNAWSLLKFMSIEAVTPSNHLILLSPSPLSSVFLQINTL